MEKCAARKLDVSSLISTLLVVSAVVVASAPMLLGDQLVVIVSGFANQVTTLLQELMISLQKLVG